MEFALHWGESLFLGEELVFPLLLYLLCHTKRERKSTYPAKLCVIFDCLRNHITPNLKGGLVLASVWAAGMLFQSQTLLSHKSWSPLSKSSTQMSKNTLSVLRYYCGQKIKSIKCWLCTERILPRNQSSVFQINFLSIFMREFYCYHHLQFKQFR